MTAVGTKRQLGNVRLGRIGHRGLMLLLRLTMAAEKTARGSFDEPRGYVRWSAFGSLHQRHNVTAQQQVITVCGASAGFGYYLEPKHDGWMKDGISKVTLTVMRDATGAFDIISKDTMTTFSARGDGAQVVKVNGSDDLRFTLVVVYPKPVTELYQFTLDRSGRGTLIWAAVKNQLQFGPIGMTKGTLFTATCSK